MKYKEIFKEIVSIMEKDSATYPDYGAGDYVKYEREISDEMDRIKFLHLVQDYLSTFKVYGHLSFNDSTIRGVGFSVMRYEDYLYVTKANQDTGLVAGDKIIFVDSMSIPEIAEKEKNMLMAEPIEREGLHWPTILKFYRTLTVKHNNNVTEAIDIKLGTKSEKRSKYYFQKYGNDTLYLRLEDFNDLENIGKLYADCKKELNSCKNLIIDVRENGGGADSGFYPLIEYSFPAGEPASKYINIEYPIAVNYSERNCRDRRVVLQNYFEGENIPADMKSMIEDLLANIDANEGKGLVLENEDTFEMIGKDNPERVWIITDEYCGSSGDAFVEIMSFSPKVTVVGRPTSGITDYSNCSIVYMDEFFLVYPTSRDSRIDHGKGLSQKGVPVDVYIPWSPESIEKDIELDYVLKQIG